MNSPRPSPNPDRHSPRHLATPASPGAPAALADIGEKTYRLGVNHFADLTAEEFAQRTLQPMKRDPARNVEVETFTPEEIELGKKKVKDWRKEGAVTPVKNQGQCGSCWAFSTTGSTEGAFFIATGELRSLSEQQLVDCSTAEGDHGCNGGLMDFGFQYILDNKGIDSEEDYAYTAVDGTCDSTKESTVAATIDSFKDVKAGSEDDLAAAILKHGPVSVAIEADQSAFQLYKSGIFNESCGTQLDHGVLAVGVTKHAYIVKNSWGESWGSDGYIMMARNVGDSGICGIAGQAAFPKRKKGDAPPAPGPSPGPSPTPPPAPSSCGCTGLGESICEMYSLHCCCQDSTTVSCSAEAPTPGECCCQSDKCSTSTFSIASLIPDFLRGKVAAPRKAGAAAQM